MITAILWSAALPRVPYPREVTELGGSVRDPEVVCHTDAALSAEGYRLRVAYGKAEVFSATEAGAFYARQTLAQLKDADGSFPCVEIADAPAYRWRGLMLDEGRHFFGKETVKELLDLMAMHKLNVFHWHLTEDQGWRMAVTKYPELLKYATVRPGSVSHKRTRENKEIVWQTYGPYFYTRADMEEIVAYAKARHIEVVPEIEIPGHARAALAAYPEFSCVGKDLKPRHPWVDIGVNKEVFCAGNDAAMKFFEDVLDEVCEIFPSKTIHIGGDECPKDRWNACPKCQARIKAEGLADAKALQGWVTRRFTDYLAKKGRKAIGWHEVLDGGAEPGRIVIQNWIQPETGVKAAADGFEVLQTPFRETYYSCPQGLEDDPFPYRSRHRLPLEKAYRFDPGRDVPEIARKNVLGSECCLWTEMIWNEFDLAWKAWPRACAFAEALWTDPQPRDYEGFARRMAVHRIRLLKRHVNCAPF